MRTVKKTIAFLFMFSLMTFGISNTAFAGNATGCFAKGIYLAGKVQVVDSFPDLKVQLVKNFPDIKVQQVRNSPKRCGPWQYVNSFPDFKLKIVTSFPDIKVSS
jgi:hypothetical protein